MRIPTLVILAGLVTVCLGPTVGPAHAEPSGPARALLDWFDHMDGFYDANPELKRTPGSGWKPFNRVRWFQKQRMVNGELPPVGARWRAWEARRALEDRRGRSSRSIWFSLGPVNFAGRMLAIDFDPVDPSILYAGAASGGVWRSTDSGITWIPISDELPSLAIGGLAVSKTNRDVIVIGTGEGTMNIDRVTGIGILRSTDRGASWIPTSLSYPATGLFGHGFHFLESGPGGTFLAGAVDGLYRSSDDGATWTQVRGVTREDYRCGYYDAKWDPEDPSRVYTVKGNDTSGNNVKVSTDDGLTWAKAGTGQPPSFMIGKSKLGVSGSTVYAFFGDLGAGTTLGLWKSTDDGATWANTSATGLPDWQSWYNLICAADPNDPEIVITGAVNLTRSTDGGSTFVLVGSNVHVDHHAVAWEPGNPEVVWVGTDGGIWESTDDGATWTDRNVALITYQFYDICVGNGPTYYVMGGTQDNGTDKWSGTTTWAEGLGGDGMVCDIPSVSDNVVYAEAIDWHFKSTEYGIEGSFVQIDNGIPGGNAQWVVPTDAAESDADYVLTNHSTAGIFRTTNGGDFWVNVAAHTATWISISEMDADVAWTIDGNTVHRTTDRGDTWTQAAALGFEAGAATKILAHPTDLSTAVVTFSGYEDLCHVAFTTDMGASWTDATGNLPPLPVSAIAIDPSRPGDWYIGTDLGVWSSADSGATWSPFEEGLPNVVIADLEIADAPRKLVAGTHGRGAWEIALPPPGGVGVTVAADRGARNLMLDPPYPNPTADRTLLRYAARSDAPGHLRIYDVNGRVVGDLAQFDRGDGIIRTTPWLIDELPSGLYFAVLEAGGERISRKITVLR
jgi:hypothetical protein